MRTLPMVAGFASLALLAGCTSSTSAPQTSAPAPLESASADTGEVAASGTPADQVQPWKAGVVPGGSGNGPAVPQTWPTATVKGSGSSTSLTPTLIAPGIDGDIVVEIVDLSAGGGFGADGTGQPTELTWSGNGRGQGTDVPTDVLRQGATYAWRALRNDDVVGGPWGFAVDAVRAATAPTDSLGGITVNMLSGQVSTTWLGNAVSGASGGLLLALEYQSPIEAEPRSVPGLPVGWSWTLPGSGIIEAKESEITSGTGDDAGPQSVVLLNAQGVGQTFVRTETGAYVPGLADGTATSYGNTASLTRVGAGVWQYTSVEGTLIRFEGGRAVSEWNGGIPIIVYSWDAQGRLASFGDGISRTMTLTYAGSGDCPAAQWGNGFDVVDGLWCATTNPDGSQTAVGYTNGQIALMADAGGIGTGFGWDASGRLSAMRDLGATAAGATVGGAWAGADLTTQVDYDDQGRVASLTAPAAEPGGQRARRTYTYPASASSGSLSASAAQSVVTSGESVLLSSDLGNGRVMEVVADVSTWRVDKRRDVDGRVSTLAYGDKSGVIERGTDETGRTMQMLTDSDALATAVIGPFTGSTEGAMRNERVIDATIDNPAAGIDSPTTAWEGLAAVVWADDVGTPQYWDRSILGNSLSGDIQQQGAWNAVATGTWKVPEGGQWRIEATSSDNLRIDVTVDGMRCSGDTAEPCVLPLKKGDRSIAVSLVGDGSGTFRVSAGRGDGTPDGLPLKDLRPGYQASTLVSTNDIVDGRRVSEQVIDTSRPWTAAPDTVRTSGDLVTRYAYESTAPAKGSWGRVTSMTTAGGATLTTAYYGNEEQATDPCTGNTYSQAGQPKSETRYDGVVVTTVYDNSGNVVSVTQQGKGGGQRACLSYDAASRPVSSVVTTLDGTELTRAENSYIWQDGRLVTSSDMTSPQGSFTTRQVTDVLERLVSYTDAWGTTTDYTYDSEGNVVSRATRLKDSSDPLLSVEYGFDESTGALTNVTANGDVLARATYDDAGLISRVTYPGDVSTSFAYAASGAVQDISVQAKGTTYTQDRIRNAAGRTLSTTVNVRGSSDKKLLNSTWDYSYDDAGRLTKAILVSSGDVAAVGGDKRTFTYSYGSPEACPTTAGADANRTGGSRDGAEFTNCYDAAFRLTSTTDPHLASDGKAEATYDDLGRLLTLTGDVPLDITWGAGTTPLTITQGNDTTAFTLAGTSIVEYNVNDAATRLSYTGPDEAPAILLDGSGQPTSVLVGLPGGALARLDPKGSLTSIEHTDIFGAQLTSTGPDGTPIGAGQAQLAPRFGPYGEPLTPNAVPAPAASYGWQAEPRNPTIGGWHDLTLSARPYHPWLGQFLAFDPVIGASTTGYGYGDTNPIDRPDYSGNSSAFEWLTLVGGVLATLGGIGTGVIKQGSARTASKLAAGVGATATLVGTYLAETSGPRDNVWETWSTVSMAVGLVSAVFGTAASYFRSSQKQQMAVKRKSPPLVGKNVGALNSGDQLRQLKLKKLESYKPMTPAQRKQWDAEYAQFKQDLFAPKPKLSIPTGGMLGLLIDVN